jgi:uncharacterized SAM-binding protein YcdF (DUF218 family)
LILVLAGTTGLGAVLLVLLGHFLNKRNLPRAPADAALVFGTGLDWKAHARWMTAAQLYRRGLAGHIIVSGGVLVPGASVTEAAWFRDKLIEQGVPADRILIEDRATNTAENARFALPIIKAHGFKTIILVMSDFEGIRAHLTAKMAWQGHGITIYDCHAPSPGRWSPWTWWLSREGWRLTWYTVPRLFRYRLWGYLWRS